MLLIFPPTAKPSEPPAGITRLAGVLKRNNQPCTLLDANIEGLLYLLQLPGSATDTWSSRAFRNRNTNIQALRSDKLYASPDRYARAVSDLNRVLDKLTPPEIALSLANYQSPLSPIKSHDLIAAAEDFTNNIYYPYFSKRLPEVLDRSAPGTIGFSLNYLSQALTTFAMIGFIRKFAPGITIILGGGLITSWLRNPAWTNPFEGLVDHLFAGPGEEPLLKFFGKENSSPPCCPDFEGLPLTDYLSPGVTLPYAASSGCYWSKCTFCPETAEANPYQTLATPQVRADLDQLTSRYTPTLLHFLDNALSPALMNSLIETPPRVPWYGFARIDNKLLNFDFCKRLRASGCVLLKLGIESGDQNVLDAMVKGIDLHTISQVLINLEMAGIGTYVYLLFGTPAESPSEARRTMEFVIQHRKAITFLNLAIFNMPVCSRETQTIATKKFYAADLGLYCDFEHPRGWDRPHVRKFLDQEFKRHPDIRPIILRDPPIFTSNHAPFFCQKFPVE